MRLEVSGGRGLALPQLVDPADEREAVALMARLARLPADRPACFPGPMPVSLDRDMFDTLRRGAARYWVCDKTDGMRCALLFCRLRGGRLDACVLLDRTLQRAFLLGIRHVPSALFQGTLLDAELAWNAELARWDCLVFDAVAVAGAHVHALPFEERIEAASRGLRVTAAADPGHRDHLRAYRPCPGADAVCLVVKRFTPAWLYAMPPLGLAAAEEAASPYATDGVILTPDTRAPQFGRNYEFFKLKSHHTVDFTLDADGGSLLVFDRAAGGLERVGRLVSSQPYPPGSVVECEYTGVPEEWRAVGVRADKTKSNDMVTFRKTLQNIREALGVDHLKAVLRGGIAPPCK